MDTKLSDKIVLISGASGGIGSTIARQFAEEGAKLVLHGHRNHAALVKLQRELPQVESLTVRADLTKEADVKNSSHKP